MSDEHFYLEATQELECGASQPALWAKSLAMCDGDENRARYFYIRERAQQLRNCRATDQEVECTPNGIEARAEGRSTSKTLSDAPIQHFQEGLTPDQREQAGNYDVRHSGGLYQYKQYEFERFVDALEYAGIIADQNAEPPVLLASLQRPKPVRRYFARLIDLTWFGLLATVIATALWPRQMALWRASPYYGTYSMAVLLVWAFVEPIFLSRSGMTPGKWMLGIRIRTVGAWAAGYGTYFERSFRVYVRGLVLGFPALSLVGMLVSYLRLRKHGRTIWDEQLQIDVVHDELQVHKVLLGVLIVVLSVALFVVYYTGI